MSESSHGPGFTYRAFISYSHRDKAWGDWLHKALETYRVPSRLVGKQTEAGTIPRRLHPVFRDREELASATDLGRTVNAALTQSENLIVICSPASAASRWVNEEVLSYKRMGRGERIFCLIIDGEPNASDMPGREPQECFCPALRYQLANGQPTNERTEPIAADAREGKDGKANAKLKLIAGMLGVGFDALKQRELQRRTRRMTATAALALVVMAITSVLAVYALVSRHEAVIAQHKAVVAQQAAQRRQKQAEGLVNFMLGDLNDKLNQVHRLDIMQAVDDKALAYFDSLPAADATDAALAMRVKALDKIGMVMTEAHGQLAASTKAYESAAALAAELAKRKPGDIGREAAWGDALNMVGVGYWQQGNLDKALQYWRQAGTLLERAHAAKPDDTNLTFEYAAIRNNTGHVLEMRGNFTGAQVEYDATQQLYQDLVARDSNNTKWQMYEGWGQDSLGKLALERGQPEQAITAYVARQRLTAALFAHNANDHSVQESLVTSDAILGRTLALCGDIDSGLSYTEEAVAQAKALLAFDPSNTGWQEYLALYSQQAGGLLRQMGRLDEAAKMDDQAAQMLAALLKKDPISSYFQQDLSQAQLESARLQLVRGNAAAAQASVQAALNTIKKLRAKAPEDRSNLLLAAQAYLILGQAAEQNNDAAIAQHNWAQALDLLKPAAHIGDDPGFLSAYAEVLLRLNQTHVAQSVVVKLNAMGYRTPDFVTLLDSKRIPYPANTVFQKKIAAILHGDVSRVGLAGSPQPHDQGRPLHASEDPSPLKH